MTTYLITAKVYSEKAAKLYPSYPFAWKHVAKFRGRIPSDESSFHAFLWNLLKTTPEGRRLVDRGFVEFCMWRPQAKDERKGFHFLCLGTIDEDHVVIERKSSEFGGVYKAIPHVPWGRQPYYEVKGVAEERRGGRFHRHRPRR